MELSEQIRVIRDVPEREPGDARPPVFRVGEVVVGQYIHLPWFGWLVDKGSEHWFLHEGIEAVRAATGGGEAVE